MKRHQWAGFAAIFILSACAQLAGIEEPIDPPPPMPPPPTLKTNGSVCSNHEECADAHCVDGVCCDDACTETCKACDVPDNVGTCSNVPIYEQDPNADDVLACVGTTHSCDGNGACKLELGQTCTADADCLWASCKNNVCTPPSCEGLTDTCGPDVMATESCCASNVVNGGTFYRSNDTKYSATVSRFRLDRFEVTVGRFRKFVEAYQGNQAFPADAGKHPLIEASGWDTSWNSILPIDKTAFKGKLKCDTAYQTWTDDPGPNERLAINCVSWYEAFAFCIWDGGRLPTEAEWNYAAAGGQEQREYPWPAMTISANEAFYNCINTTCTLANFPTVGSKSPAGDAKWFQADMAGSVWEWTLDVFQDPYGTPCDNCANVSPIPMVERVIRGGGWYPGEAQQHTSFRDKAIPSARQSGVGIRCARDR